MTLMCITHRWLSYSSKYWSY